MNIAAIEAQAVFHCSSPCSGSARIRSLILYPDSWAFCGYTESIILGEVSRAVSSFQFKVVIWLGLRELEAHTAFPGLAFQFFGYIFLAKQLPCDCSGGRQGFILQGFVSRILLQFLLFFLEIQDPNRRSTSPKAHGVSGRCGASRHHERQRQLLDDPTRIPRKGSACAGEAWCDCSIDPKACSHHMSKAFFSFIANLWTHSATCYGKACLWPFDPKVRFCSGFLG